MNASEFHSSRQFTATPFGRIAHVERGAGLGALFVHGLPLCGFQWRETLDDLAPVRRCIAPDLMGLGYTDIKPGQDISFESQAKMLAAFLDAREIGQVDLVGNDTGGGVSQIFAALNPDRVRTLTLTNCEVHDLWPNAMLQQFYGALKSGIVGETFKVIWGEADTAFDTRASLESMRANLGGLRRVTTVPRAKLFWPEEHPRLLSVLLKDFWASN